MSKDLVGKRESGRDSRVDALGLRRYVMGWDLDGRGSVRDDWREQGFIGRGAALSERDAFTGYHSSLLANHSHLLVRTGRLPLRRALIRPPSRSSGSLENSAADFGGYVAA